MTARLPGTSAAAMRTLAPRRAVVVTVEGAAVAPAIIEADVAPLGDVTVPGADDAAVLGDLEELMRPPEPGEYLGGTLAWSGDGGLEPATVWRAVRTSLATAGRGSTGIFGWLLLLVIVALMWWFFLGLLLWGLGAVALNRRRLLVSPGRVEWQAGKDSFVVEGPWKMRAKIRFSRGTQSKKRKTKAALVFVDQQRVEHLVPFPNPEALLRATRALAVTHGVPWRLDVKLRGERLDGAKLEGLLPLPSSSSSSSS